MAQGRVTARTYDINGWFEVADNPISREGVFPYSGGQIGAPDRGKIYQVYRPAEELSAPETLASFRLLPLINDHTMLGAGAAPAEDVGVDGVIGEQVKFADGVLSSNLKIFSNSLAQDIKDGKTELSCGYRCVYDFTPGVWNGQAYDAVQRQIRGNHLALVDEGRMGPQVAILDQMTFTVDAKEHMTAMDEELKAMLAAIVARLDKLEAGEVGEVKPAVADAGAPPPPPPAPVAKDAEVPPALAAAAEEKSEGMDALSKDVKALAAKVSGMVVLDEAAVVQTLARKSALADRLSRHVGTFDHAAMTLDGVVKYGIEKLGLKDVPAGSEAVALDAALQVRPVAQPFAATDSAAPSPLGKSIAVYAGKA